MRITITEAEQYLSERLKQSVHYESTGGGCTAFMNKDETLIVTHGYECDVNEVVCEGYACDWLIETDGFWSVGFYEQPAYEGYDASKIQKIEWEKISA